MQLALHYITVIILYVYNPNISKYITESELPFIFDIIQKLYFNFEMFPLRIAQQNCIYHKNVIKGAVISL